MRFTQVFLGGVLVLTGSACMEDFSLDPERVGFIDARAFEDGGSNVLRVSAGFYRGYGLDVLVGLPGLCQVLAYNPEDDTSGAETVSAGPSLTATVSGANSTVPRITTGTYVSYAMPLGANLPYVPGDTLAVSIPGDAEGFPAATVKVRTAEPFVMEAVVPPPAGPSSTEVIWTPAPVPGSVMTLSLRYSTEDGVMTPNAQIYCVFVDDGSAILPDAVRTAWVASAPESRSQFAQRVREASVAISGSTRVRIFSFYEVPTPSLGGT